MDQRQTKTISLCNKISMDAKIDIYSQSVMAMVSMDIIVQRCFEECCQVNNNNLTLHFIKQILGKKLEKIEEALARDISNISSEFI